MAQNNSNSSTNKAEIERRQTNGKTAKLCILVMILVGVIDAFNGFGILAKGFSMIALPFLDSASTEYAVWAGNVGLFFYGVKAVLFLGAGGIGYLSTKNNEA